MPSTEIKTALSLISIIVIIVIVDSPYYLIICNLYKGQIINRTIYRYVLGTETAGLHN